MGGNVHSSLTCCCGLRKNNQCCFPCRNCCNSSKAAFYNFDGTEAVEPLVGSFKPSKSSIRKDYIPGMKLDRNTLSRGLNPIQQLVYLCKYARDNHFKVRAIGKGFSWSNLICTRDILVIMTSLNRILTPKPKSKASNPQEIEVQGGMILKKFVRALDKKFGLALPIVAGFLGQTVAGAISTATHGSSYSAQNLSAYVVGLHLIISGGIQVKIRGGDESIGYCRQMLSQAVCGDVVEFHSDQILRAAAVSLGSMGIIYSITFTCVSLFRLKDMRIELDVPAPRDQPFKLPEKFDNLYTGPNNTFFSFFINPIPRPDPDTEFSHDAVYWQSQATKKYTACGTCCGSYCNFCCLPGGRGCVDSCFCQGDIAACMALSCARNKPKCTSKFNTCVLDTISRSYPYTSKYYRVLELTRGKTRVRTAEYAIPMEHMENALQDIFELAVKYMPLYTDNLMLPIYCRLVKSDNLYLSPANECRPNGTSVERYLYIELPFLPGSHGVEEYLNTVEEILIRKYQARPHWAKYHNLNYDTIKSLYPQLAEWEEVYHLLNPDHMFDNMFTVSCGFCDKKDFYDVNALQKIIACPTGHNDIQVISTEEMPETQADGKTGLKDVEADNDPRQHEKAEKKEASVVEDLTNIDG